MTPSAMCNMHGRRVIRFVATDEVDDDEGKARERAMMTKKFSDGITLHLI